MILYLCNKNINKKYFEWKNYVGKLPIKNKIERIYSRKEIDHIIEQYLIYCKNNFDFEITDFWLRIRNNLDNPKLSKISMKTIKRILEDELGLVFKRTKKYLRKHPKRHYFAKSGIVQLDLKIIGKNDTKLNKNVTVFNMIETRSRFVFSKVLDSGNINNILDALKEGKNKFEQHSITIKSIQTDNAMMFKGNNFIHCDNYNNFLTENKIIKRLIPLGVPECNGCIERYHLTIDKKCSTALSMAKTLEDVKKIINDFSDHYNYHRYHYYSELESIKSISYNERYLIPAKAIKALYNYE